MRRIQVKSAREVEVPSYEFPEIDSVRDIISEVKKHGDSALREFTSRFDGADIGVWSVGVNRHASARSALGPEQRQAVQLAADNLRRFSRRQLSELRDFSFPVMPGVLAGQTVIPLGRVGIYVPGGRYPLVSTLLMGAIPAQTAGVKEILVCSPPLPDGSLPEILLAAADIIGVKEIYRVGGAQAVAAMAYGTESIRPVDKIVGPGNVYVNAAKRLVYGDVGIDFIAGPTEILILADDGAEAEFIAADLIAQAEHDPHARPLFMTTSEKAAGRVEKHLGRLLKTFPPDSPAPTAIRENGVIYLVESWEEASALANRLAPEHLQLQVANPESWKKRLRNYGSLFLGGWTAEVLGDYSSGISHILPTGRAARYSGGLGVRDFLKFQTHLAVTAGGLEKIGPAARCLAEMEGLCGHAAAVEVRMRRVQEVFDVE